MVAQSQSGTGKTAAFLLTTLYRVDSSLNHPQAVILSPTYELALQTMAVAKKMARFRPDITFAQAVRGEELSRLPVQDHVVIGTPGKVNT
jgi:ATP-dependent RNA helicase DDX19/DBP5